MSAWIPALDGVESRAASRRRQGRRHRLRTRLVDDPARAGIPRTPRSSASTTTSGSIETARKRAAEAGVADRVRFEVASAQDFPGTDYDLVCIFDVLHDMGDPVGAARHIRDALADDGTWLLVEPMAVEGLENNVNPVSRIFYAGAVGICTPAAEAQAGGLRARQPGRRRPWAELLGEAGFSRFRRATETPFNRVFEVRK